MAIPLSAKQNTVTPAFPYSFGRIKDNPGDNTGTPVDEPVYGDFHQFFAVLLNAASVTPNGLNENGSNGYQYLQALQNMINVQSDFFHIVGAALQPAFQNSFATSTFASTTGAAFKLEPKTNRVLLRGCFQRATESNNTTVFTLPVAYRPQVAKTLPILMYNNSVYVSGTLRIDTSGNVQVNCNAGDSATLATYIIDGLAFDLDF